MAKTQPSSQPARIFGPSVSAVGLCRQGQAVELNTRFFAVNVQKRWLLAGGREDEERVTLERGDLLGSDRWGWVGGTACSCSCSCVCVLVTVLDSMNIPSTSTGHFAGFSVQVKSYCDIQYSVHAHDSGRFVV